MHILAAHYRSEFLATPQLLRIDYPMGSNGFEPTILIKGSTLLLKYIVLGAQLRLHLARIEGRLLYALTVFDDKSHPAILWSIMEREEEANTLKDLVSGHTCPIFLFNELALNVAWSTLKLDLSLEQEIEDWISAAELGPVDYQSVASRADELLLHAYHGTASTSELVTANFNHFEPWNPLFNHFITSHGTASPVDLFSKDEGGQQEQLAVWLTDSLHPLGVHHSPQIPKGPGYRELTDVLLSYERGAFLIESKALTVFSREALPSRAKLAKDVTQHVEKAVRQLRGSIRRLKDGAPVTSRSGSSIQVELSYPMHAIILIPEFALIEDYDRYGRGFIDEFVDATGSYIHLLDIAELLRVVQAAEILSRGSAKITPLMAFDYYLIERAKRTYEADTLCIEVLLRTKNSAGSV